MLTFEKFSGINNVLPSHRLGADALAEAIDVDIGLSGELRRRAGYTEVSEDCHKNLWQARGFMLSTIAGDLTAMDAAGAARVTLLPSIGMSRLWYCNLPDGRATFSNGLINGITDGKTATGWGIPVPASVGALTAVPGALFRGDYRWQLTYVRESDGLEGAPAYSAPVPIQEGGLVLLGLPVLDGYSINVYLTGHNGEEAFLAGNTTTGAFSYTGKNDALVLPCRTDHLQPAPAGTVSAFWRGRALIACGSALYASRPYQWELFDFRRDLKQFGAPITLVQPVDDGIYVGTTHELAFLAGVEFDKLAYRQVLAGRVVLGSGVEVRGELVKQGDGAGQGTAMLCIADRGIVAGFNSGGVVRMTQGHYRVDVVEVAATFRTIDGIPQYLAVPQ